MDEGSIRCYTIVHEDDVYPFIRSDSADYTDEAFLSCVRQIRAQQGDDQSLFGMLDSLEKLGFRYVKGPSYIYINDELA